MATTIATLKVLLTADDKDFDRGMKSASSHLDELDKKAGITAAQIQSLASSMATAGAAMATTFGTALAFAIKSASDLSEATNKVQVVFGDAAKSIEDFAKSSATNLGLSRAATLDYAGSLGNMFVSMKLTNTGAAELSKGILALAADIASFNNINVTEALDKLKSGLQGEAEPLRAVGVLLSDVAIKAKAAEVGIKGKADALSEAQKVLLRYLVILDQTEKAQGDFARTSTGMANSARILQAQFQDLAAEIGGKFTTATNTALGVVVQMMAVFNNLPPSIMGAAAAFLAIGTAVGAATLAIGAVVALIGGPLTLALAGLVAWVGAISIGIAQNWDAISEATQGLSINWTGAFRAMAGAAGYIVDIISAVARQVIIAFDVILNGARIMANGVVAAFQSLKASVGNIFQAIAAGDVIGMANALTQSFGQAFTSAGAAMSADLSALANRAMTGMRATADFLGGSTSRAFMAAFDKGVNAAQSFDFSKLKQKILDELNGLQGAAEKGGKGTGKAAADAMRKEMIDGVNEMLDTLKVGVKVSKGYWDQMANDVKSSLVAQAAVVKQLNNALKDIAIDRALNEKRQIDISIFNWERLPVAIKKAVTDAGIAVKVTFPGIINEFELLKLAMVSAEKAGGEFAKEMGFVADKLSDKLGDALEEINKAAPKTTEILKKEAAQWADFVRKNVEKIREDIHNNLGKGLGDVAILIGKAMGASLGEVRKFSTGLLEIIDGIPGKMGDRLREGANKVLEFVNRIDTLLRGLHKIFNQIPDGLGAMIEKVVGLFKGSGGKSRLEQALDEMIGPVTKSGGNSGQGFASGFLGKLGLISSGIATFFATRGQGEAVGLAGSIAAGAQMGAAFGGGFGAAAGAAIGAFIGGFKSDSKKTRFFTGGLFSLFFGGKSDEEKAAEKKAKEEAVKQAALSAQDFVNTVNQGILDTMSKGLALLESIAASEALDVPRKALRRFVNKLMLILGEFVEQTKQFSIEAAKHAGEVSENLGKGIELMLGGAQLIDAINKAEDVSDSKIQSFINTTLSIAQAWLEATEKIELGVAKRAGKISERLKASFELISAIPEAIAGIIGAAAYKPVGANAFDAFIADLALVLDKVIKAAETIDKELLKKAADIGESVGKVMALIKSAFEGLASVREYKGFTAELFDQLAADIKLAVDKLGAIAASIGQEAATKAGEFAQSAGKVVGIIKDAVDAFNALDDLQNVESGPFAAIEIYIRRSIELMARVAGSVTDELMAQVEVFSNKTKAVFDALKSAVSVFVDLSNLSGGRDNAGGNFPDISTAFERLAAFTEKAVERIAQMANSDASQMVDSALVFAAKAQQIFSLISAGVSALKGLGELTASPFDGFNNLANGFATALYKMVDLVGKAGEFRDLAADFKSRIMEAVRDLQAGMTSIASATMSGAAGYGGVEEQSYSAYMPRVDVAAAPSVPSGTSGGSSSGGRTSGMTINFEPGSIAPQGGLIYEGQVGDLIIRKIEEAERQGRLSLGTPATV
jgi:hypothetical protein